MTVRTLIQKITYIALSLYLVVVFTGCSDDTAYLDNAMQLIKSMDYQEALTELDYAEESGENIRLVSRARGIAYMGMTDYKTAITFFEQALESSNGLLQDIDFDLNYYLAAAYTKDGRYSEAEEIYNACSKKVIAVL